MSDITKEEFLTCESCGKDSAKPMQNGNAWCNECEYETREQS